MGGSESCTPGAVTIGKEGEGRVPALCSSLPSTDKQTDEKEEKTHPALGPLSCVYFLLSNQVKLPVENSKRSCRQEVVQLNEHGNTPATKHND